jgi:hypothetical protein
MAASERDISLARRLDQLAARLAAAEDALTALRAEYAELVAAQAAANDDENDPHPEGEWLGHELVERAIEMLRPTADAEQQD